jgi:CBS domain-containing protein
MSRGFLCDMLAADYIKAHGRKIADVMTQNVITATPNMPLDEIAILLEIGCGVRPVRQY